MAGLPVEAENKDEIFREFGRGEQGKFPRLASADVVGQSLTVEAKRGTRHEKYSRSSARS